MKRLSQVTAAWLLLIIRAPFLFPRKGQQRSEPTLAQANARKTAQSGYCRVFAALAAPSLHRSLGSLHSRAPPHRPNAIAEAQGFGAGVSSENRIPHRLKNNAVTGQDRRLIINKKNGLSGHLVLSGGATAVACPMCVALHELEDEDWRSRKRLVMRVKGT